VESEKIIKAVGQVAAALLGAVGLIYGLGGAIVWLRLAIYGEQSLPVVAALPREVLVSVGLVVVLLALAVGLGYIVGRGLLWTGARKPPRKTDAGKIKFWVVASLMAVPPGLIFGISVAFARVWPDDVWEWQQPLGVALFVAGLLVIGAGMAFLALKLWRLFGEDYWISARKAESNAPDHATRDTQAKKNLWIEDRVARNFKTPTAIGLGGLIWAVASAPAFFLAAAALPLTEGRVCIPGPAHLDGGFIGESAERVYVTDTDGNRIASIPKEQITRVYIGTEARDLGQDTMTSTDDITGGSCPKTVTP
jgi:hypothetical protein